MENVCEYLRGNKLSSFVWDSYAAMLEAWKQPLLFLVNDPERIVVSIGTKERARVEG